MRIKSIFFALVSFFCLGTAVAQKGLEFYQITVYHFKTPAQEATIDEFLQNSLVPALHKKISKTIGVFKPIANDTASEKRIFILIPLNSLQEAASIAPGFAIDGSPAYANAEYNNPPYTRIENILLQAFPLQPKMDLPKLSGPKEERIYELRNYESSTEKFYRNKVKMFNEGGEIALFKRLNFNAIFYGEVIAGSRIPNLMYMTSFENKVARDEHWKSFVESPEWKKLVAMPEYQHNMSRLESILMRAAKYSDY